MQKRLVPVVLALSCSLLLLTGCEDYRYHRAERLYSDHRYEEAAEIFAELGNYEDSESMTLVCLYKAAYELTRSGDYEGALKIYEQIPNYRDVPELIVEAKRQIELKTYDDVIERLMQKIWYHNGGSDTKLERVTFRRGKGSIEEIYFDKKGRHSNGTIDFKYMLDDSTITMTFDDGGEQAIAYRKTKNSVKLGDGEYLTQKQVERDLRGCWQQPYAKRVLEMTTRGIRSVQIRKKHIKYEYAATSPRVAYGQYYFYGPYRGEFTLGTGCFETDMTYGDEWFFNVIDGKGTLLHLDKICTRVELDELPGEDGYVFSDAIEYVEE